MTFSRFQALNRAGSPLVSFKANFTFFCSSQHNAQPSITVIMTLSLAGSFDTDYCNLLPVACV